MRTLGVDLASQPAKTGVAVLSWAEEGGARVEQLTLGADDATLEALCAEVDAVGIDAPFGWPEAFTEMLGGATPAPWSDDARDRLRFRRTDHAVRAALGRWPLSVSSDLIGVPAMRCHGLLHRLGVEDRSGDGRVFETYPALGLSRWGLPSKGYKGKRGVEVRRALVSRLRAEAPWLHLTRGQVAQLVAEDDALDAMVAGLLARAAVLGHVEPVPPADREAARAEGWIVIPTPGSLAKL